MDLSLFAFGEVSRQIEVDDTGIKGIGTLFDALDNASPKNLDGEAKRIRESIRQSRLWAYSEHIKSPGIQLAHRAWNIRGVEVHDLVEDWLCNPHNFRGQRKLLQAR